VSNALGTHKVDFRRAAIGGLPKRAIDITVALIALVLVTPIMLAVAALIRIFMAGPIILTQERIGLGGRTFACYKFRTMVGNAERGLDQQIASSQQSADARQETRKREDDPRGERLGGALRRSSLDELPQLFNVLRGDMSLVGPLPIAADKLERYRARAPECFLARPGLTGMSQATGRNRSSRSMRIALDRYYVRHWSMCLDLVLLIKTIPAVFNFNDRA
jgi:exopolysaccharide production protein ExoY